MLWNKRSICVYVFSQSPQVIIYLCSTLLWFSENITNISILIKTFLFSTLLFSWCMSVWIWIPMWEVQKKKQKSIFINIFRLMLLSLFFFCCFLWMFFFLYFLTIVVVMIYRKNKNYMISVVHDTKENHTHASHRYSYYFFLLMCRPTVFYLKKIITFFFIFCFYYVNFNKPTTVNYVTFIIII